MADLNLEAATARAEAVFAAEDDLSVIVLDEEGNKSSAGDIGADFIPLSSDVSSSPATSAVQVVEEEEAAVAPIEGAGSDVVNVEVKATITGAAFPATTEQESALAQPALPETLPSTGTKEHEAPLAEPVVDAANAPVSDQTHESVTETAEPSPVVAAVEEDTSVPRSESAPSSSGVIDVSTPPCNVAFGDLAPDAVAPQVGFDMMEGGDDAHAMATDDKSHDQQSNEAHKDGTAERDHTSEKDSHWQERGDHASEDSSDIKCYGCGAYGHFQRQCPNDKCRLCGVAGHYKADCPQRDQRMPLSSDAKCHTCGESGHFRAECPQGSSRAGGRSERGGGHGGRDSRGCYNCGRPGHIARECRSAPSSRGGRASSPSRGRDRRETSDRFQPYGRPSDRPMDRNSYPRTDSRKSDFDRDVRRDRDARGSTHGGYRGDPRDARSDPRSGGDRYDARSGGARGYLDSTSRDSVYSSRDPFDAQRATAAALYNSAIPLSSNPYRASVVDAYASQAAVAYDRYAAGASRREPSPAGDRRSVAAYSRDRLDYGSSRASDPYRDDYRRDDYRPADYRSAAPRDDYRSSRASTDPRAAASTAGYFDARNSAAGRDQRDYRPMDSRSSDRYAMPDARDRYARDSSAGGASAMYGGVSGMPVADSRSAAAASSAMYGANPYTAMAQQQYHQLQQQQQQQQQQQPRW